MADKQDLFPLLKKGDARAQRILYDLFKGRLMGLCRRYAKDRDEAQDILQETFIKVFTRIGQLESAEKLESWMRSIAVHTAINHYHRSRTRQALFKQQPEDESGFQVSSVENLSDELLVGLVNGLPDGCRIVFNLFAIEGYSHAEIAELLKIGEGTSRSQLYHAKLLLKEKLKCHSMANYYEKFA